jgi:predicted ATPase/DNA-binding SARP family transcriptional activator
MAVEASRIFSSDPDDGNPPVRLRVRLLGGFGVEVDGRAVPEAVWRQRRAAGVVKLLALEPGHRMHREQLMELLWPDLDYSSQLNNLRQALHHSRRALELAGMPAGLALTRDGDIVVLAPADLVWVDAHAFEEAVAGAWQLRTPASADAALALYRGDLLPDDRYEEWVEQRRTTLRTGYLALLARLAALYEERGEPVEAIGAWQRLLAAAPTNEAAHTALMRLYAGSGQRQPALTQFDQLVTILERELDAAPEPATLELADSIREGRFPEHDRSTIGLAGPGVVQSNVPIPISQLVGRQQELAELGQLLTTERLLTLTGPGGIGKTRLAIEVARRASDRVTDGVVFVDLTPVRDPARVIPAIAEAIGVREDGSRALEVSLAASLRDRRMLLVLDNAEQVAVAGPAIAQLLERAPSLKALITSRVVLRLRGEREYPVQPLGVAEAESPAVRLFISRARDVQPNFTLTDDNAATVTEICRRLDGLPLAIELAAARSRVLSPQAILNRLNDPLALLTTGAADLPERQRTIRATIQWSYDLLNPFEQQVFDRLSVFVGGWTLDAAEALLGDFAQPVDVLDGLDSLAGKHLITRIEQPGGDARFRMLETIREFGLERLAATGDGPAARDRHAGWVVQLVEEAARHIEGAEQAHWLARLERDSDNIRAGQLRAPSRR